MSVVYPLVKVVDPPPVVIVVWAGSPMFMLYPTNVLNRSRSLSSMIPSPLTSPKIIEQRRASAMRYDLVGFDVSGVIRASTKLPLSKLDTRLVTTVLYLYPSVG